MEKISFQTNIWQELRLAFLEGKPVEGRFGDQYLFSTTDNRCFYVSPSVGQIIEKQLLKLKMERGELIEICKAELDVGRGRKQIQWIVRKVGLAPGEQPDGTFAVPNAGADAGTPAPAATTTPSQAPSTPVVNGNGNRSKAAVNRQEAAPLPEERSKTKLEDALCTVVAAVFAATQYAKDLGYQMPPFTSEDIRTMANTLMIQNGNGGKNGGNHVS